MKGLVIAFLLFLSIGGDDSSKTSGLHKIARINAEKKLAHAAYTQDQFEEALKHYTILTDSFKVSEPEIWLNKGHAAFRMENFPAARQAYVEASQSSNKKISSVAWQQLGLLELQQQKKDQALEMFKKAMLTNSNNEEARYNYELALKQKQQEQKQDQNKDDKKEDQKKEEQKKEEQNQSKPDQKEDQKQDQKEQQQEQGQQDENSEDEAQPKPKSKEEQFKEINISEEKAKMLLDAMKNSEKQYLQQLKKEPTKPKDKTLKDW